MKKIFAFCSLFLILATGSSPGQGTPVLFSLQSLLQSGQVTDRTILIQPDRSSDTPLWYGTNLVPTFDFTIQTTNGSIITNLTPWGYTIKVDLWPRSIHIWVPATNTVQNVVNLINTNKFSPLYLTQAPQLNQGANIVLVTNSDGSITISSSGGGVTNNQVLTGIPVVTNGTGISNLPIVNISGPRIITNTAAGVSLSGNFGGILSGYAAGITNSSLGPAFQSDGFYASPFNNNVEFSILWSEQNSVWAWLTNGAFTFSPTLSIDTNGYVRGDGSYLTNLNISTAAGKWPPPVVTNGYNGPAFTNIVLGAGAHTMTYSNAGGGSVVNVWQGPTNIFQINLWQRVGGVGGAAAHTDLLAPIGGAAYSLYDSGEMILNSGGGAQLSLAGDMPTLEEVRAINDFGNLILNSSGNVAFSGTAYGNGAGLTNLNPTAFMNPSTNGQVRTTINTDGSISNSVPGTTVSWGDTVNGNIWRSVTNYSAVPVTINMQPGLSGYGALIKYSTNANFTISNFVPVASLPSSVYLVITNSAASAITGTIAAAYAPFSSTVTNSMVIKPSERAWIYVDSFDGISTNLSDKVQP